MTVGYRTDAVVLRRLLGEAVTLDFDLDCGGAAVRIDVGQFEAALVNLAVNARDAAPMGRIQICARRDFAAGQIRIDVQDDGEGMDGDTLARAFEPFFTTKPVGKGTGLGLSQVYGFAKQSGGEVAIDSAPGQGARITLILPVEAAAAVQPVAAAPEDAHTASAMTVLLVEDDASVAEVVRTMLEELGHTVLSEENAADALAHALREPRSGVDLARDLARERPGLPVVLSSGYTGEELTHAEAAPWPLLRKPYALEALTAAIREAADNPQALIAGHDSLID